MEHLGLDPNDPVLPSKQTKYDREEEERVDKSLPGAGRITKFKKSS